MDLEANSELIAKFGARYIRLKDVFENDMNVIIAKIKSQNPMLLGNISIKFKSLEIEY